ncbi:hypothetical protein GDO81_018308 [Engystomops pustulosus]|uniref:Uncharacterized protein n=1 Tax=Engystomops pustulosus TaxID=76066 RepID=A0AAV7A613_ENGPU|nr:hypothetical protein GDO81_018308 [Engystomops pustulosus]
MPKYRCTSIDQVGIPGAELEIITTLPSTPLGHGMGDVGLWSGPGRDLLALAGDRSVLHQASECTHCAVDISKGWSGLRCQGLIILSHCFVLM